MRRLAFIALAALALLFGSQAALAQGSQCRTATVGASTPNCASEAFVTESISAIPSGGTVTEQKNTGSVGIATSGNCDNTSTNSASPCDAHMALNNATLQASPSNPTGTGNLTGLMMGLGSTCKLTPAYSGRVKLEFIGQAANTVAGDGTIIKVFFGTGTSPVNAAAITGTQVANSLRIDQPIGSGSFFLPFVNGGIVTGLAPGTAYWFDISVAANGGTSTTSSISCNAFEF